MDSEKEQLRECFAWPSPPSPALSTPLGNQRCLAAARQEFRPRAEPSTTSQDSRGNSRHKRVGQRTRDVRALGSAFRRSADSAAKEHSDKVLAMGADRIHSLVGDVLPIRLRKTEAASELRFLQPRKRRLIPLPRLPVPHVGIADVRHDHASSTRASAMCACAFSARRLPSARAAARSAGKCASRCARFSSSSKRVMS